MGSLWVICGLSVGYLRALHNPSRPHTMIESSGESARMVYCSGVCIRRAGAALRHGAMAAMGGTAARAPGTKLEESVIDFGSVVAGKVVRAVKIDGVYHMPRRDVIMAVSNCDNKAASDVWRKSISDDEKKDLSDFCRNHKFDGTWTAPFYSP